MSLPPEGRINPGRDHGAEKSGKNKDAVSHHFVEE
jgi:hypothetical protein